ncbi:MAG: FAD-dependent oxidoreductase [Methylobacteriaceae bacterium]|nr:FAD-dependent oxidoreductase [Methylobacteriaceae bacterium]
MTKPIRAAIVGGGISGLCAANALLRRGVDVTVYEQAPALGEVGAGVFTYPNALRPCSGRVSGRLSPRWVPRSGRARNITGWTARWSARC